MKQSEKRNEQIYKSIKNEYIRNACKIKDYNTKLSLYDECTKGTRTANTMVYTLGFSILLSCTFLFINKSALIDYKIVTASTLLSSVTLGNICARIRELPYKRALKRMKLYNKEKIEEDRQNCFIDRQNILDYNKILSQILQDIRNNKVSFFTTNRLDYRTREEIVKEIKMYEEELMINKEQLEIVSNKRTVDNLKYDGIERYVRATLLSLVGVFSICYLPNISLNSTEVLSYCIGFSLIANVPINLLTINNIRKDKKLQQKLETEANMLINTRHIDAEYNKLFNLIYARKLKFLSDEMILASTKENVQEQNYSKNNIREDIIDIEETKNNVLIKKMVK